MDEGRLVEKLRAIEALFAGAATDGERVAADRARLRILERLREVERSDPAIEYRFSMTDAWSKRLFLALCRRYGLEPYRYGGQRHTTVMVRAPRGFVDNTLWPEFQEISRSLRAYLAEVTDRVVAEVLHADASEERVLTRGELPPHGSEEANMDEGAGDEAPSKTAPPGNRAARRAAAKNKRKGRG